MLSDDEITSKVHVAEVTEVVRKKNPKWIKIIKLDIENVGECYITKKHLPKVELIVGASLTVNLQKHDDGRWLVSKLISINGEPYTRLEPRTKQEKAKPKPKKPKIAKNEQSIREGKREHVEHTNVCEQFPDLDNSFSLGEIFSLQSLTILSAPRIKHGVVVHT